MSQTVIIPNCMNPFEVTINNHTYSFKSGESIELPDEVAEVIKHHVDSVPKPLDKEEGSEGSSGGGENKLNQLFTNTLTEVTAEDLAGVTKIKAKIFKDCNTLIKVTIPDTVTLIEDNTFENCTGIINLVIPNSVTAIYNYAFYGCSNLTNIILPNDLKLIGTSLFSSCSSLTSITIPNRVTRINSGAFYGCTSLQRVKVLATTPPTIESSTFSKVPDTCIYEVPAAAYETYKAATNWSALNIVASEEF